MLQELLDTRVMVKNSMKLHNKLANQDPGKQAFIHTSTFNYFCLRMIKKTPPYLKVVFRSLILLKNSSVDRVSF